jgi:hypothetical protein
VRPNGDARWGTVCGVGFGDDEAAAFCEALGVDASDARASRAFSRSAATRAQQPVWLEGADCGGEPRPSLDACGFRGGASVWARACTDARGADVVGLWKAESGAGAYAQWTFPHARFPPRFIREPGAGPASGERRCDDRRACPADAYCEKRDGDEECFAYDAATDELTMTSASAPGASVRWSRDVRCAFGDDLVGRCGHDDAGVECG